MALMMSCSVPPMADPAPRWVEYSYAPDGSGELRWGWWANGRFHWREVDQPGHAMHVETPLQNLWWGRCYSNDCNPTPPGWLPRSRHLPHSTVTGLPE
jgi:hypothetical protein